MFALCQDAYYFFKWFAKTSLENLLSTIIGFEWQLFRRWGKSGNKTIPISASVYSIPTMRFEID
jgi:hypothetical protein